LSPFYRAGPAKQPCLAPTVAPLVNTYAWPGPRASLAAPTTMVAPEMATDRQNHATRCRPVPVSSVVWRQPVAPLVNTYARPAPEAWPCAPTTMMVPEGATDHPKSSPGYGIGAHQLSCLLPALGDPGETHKLGRPWRRAAVRRPRWCAGDGDRKPEVVTHTGVRPNQLTVWVPLAVWAPGEHVGPPGVPSVVWRTYDDDVAGDSARPPETVTAGPCRTRELGNLPPVDAAGASRLPTPKRLGFSHGTLTRGLGDWSCSLKYPPLSTTGKTGSTVAHRHV